MTKFNNFNFKNFYKKYFNLDSEKLLRIMIKDFFYKRIAVTSSFGAESAVILHLVSKIDNNTPIIFLNTNKLFPETLKYLKIIRKELNLTNIKIFKPDQNFLKKYDYIFTTGGIGPTHDDVTSISIAKAFRVKLVKNKKALKILKKFYNLNKQPLNKVREKMALIPEGAELLHNPITKVAGFKIKNVYFLTKNTLFPGIN